MSNLKIGAHVMIDTPLLEYPYNGKKGTICTIIPDQFDKLLYIVELKEQDDLIPYVVMYEDYITLIETNPERKLTAQTDINGTNTHTCPCEFDLTKYLSDEEIQKIAQRVFEERISFKVDNIIKTRTEANHKSLTDMVFDKVILKYVEQLTPKFENQLLEKINMISEGDWKEESAYGDSLYQTVIYGLSKCIGEYIDDHRYQVTDLIIDRIHNVVENLTDDALRSIIKTKFPIDNIIEIILKGSEKE